MTERNLYSGFNIAGGRVSAYMPMNDEDDLVWTIEFVKDGVVHTATAPMIHPPIFGPDVEDLFKLNETIELLIKKWGLE